MNPHLLLDASKRLGKNITDCRREEKITQEYLASEVGVTREYINMIENGRAYPDFDVLIKIAWELKKQIPELIEGITLDFTNW